MLHYSTSRALAKSKLYETKISNDNNLETFILFIAGEVRFQSGRGFASANRWDQYECVYTWGGIGELANPGLTSQDCYYNETFLFDKINLKIVICRGVYGYSLEEGLSNKCKKGGLGYLFRGPLFACFPLSLQGSLVCNKKSPISNEREIVYV